MNFKNKYIICFFLISNSLFSMRNEIQLITTHKKSNGTLLRIVTSKIMDIQDIAGWNGQENWFYLTFNNTTLDPSSMDYIVFEPPLMDDGNYTLLGNQPYGPQEPTWVYHPGPGWHTNVQGGAFRLPNGNTLLTVCDDAEIYEVTYEGQQVWEYTHSGNNTMIARAQKYAIGAFDQEIILGDINGDEILNVLDVILIVNMALGTAEIDLNGDMNDDGGINVLDIVLLVNIILS